MDEAKHDIIKHDPPHPPKASAGGDNAYYLRGCETVGRSPSYASCLYKLNEADAGREHDSHKQCRGAINCPARDMRAQESEAGIALFYYPRKSPQALHLSHKVTGEFGVRITNLTDPALIPPDPKSMRRPAVHNPTPLPATLDDALQDTGTGYAEAITAAVADLAVEPEKEPAKPAPAKAPEPAPMQAVSLPSKTATRANAGPPPGQELDRFVQSLPLPQYSAPARPAMNPGETPLQYARRLAALKTQPT